MTSATRAPMNASVRLAVRHATRCASTVEARPVTGRTTTATLTSGVPHQVCRTASTWTTTTLDAFPATSGWTWRSVERGLRVVTATPRPAGFWARPGVARSAALDMDRHGFERAPSHKKRDDLPSNADMAAMLRAGESIEDLGARLGVTWGRIQTRLNDAGWGRDGQPNHRPPRPRKVLVGIEEPWVADALCAQTDPEAFFPEKGGSTRPAKAICVVCPVRLPCLDHALATDERFGVRGGLSERERRKMKKGMTVSSRVPGQAEVRAWAAEQGIRVAEVGRVRTSVMDAYIAAHPEAS